VTVEPAKIVRQSWRLEVPILVLRMTQEPVRLDSPKSLKNELIVYCRATLFWLPKFLFLYPWFEGRETSRGCPLR
jgi:hypothetical protein